MCPDRFVCSHTNTLFHVFDVLGKVVDLLLHLGFVLLKVGEACLQLLVFFLLSSDGSIVGITC